MADPTPGYPAFSEFSDVSGELRDTYEAMRAEVERLRRDWNFEMDERCSAQRDVLRLQTYLSEACERAEKWRAEYSRLAGDYAEEASYLRKRAERAEDIAKSVRTGAPLYDMLEQRNAAITRAEQAEAEVERLKEDYRNACKTVAQVYAAATGRPGEGPFLGVIEDAAAVRAERDALQAEVERLKADAERYRWLRREVDGPHAPLAQILWKFNNIRDNFRWTNLSDGQTLDEHIDAARG